MSKVHVRQVEGYLVSHLKGAIDMSDYAGHSDPAQGHKAFLTRALAGLAVYHLTAVALHEVPGYVTDGGNDGGIDLIYFDPSERTLYLVQSKWHDDGHGSISLGEALKFIEGVKKVLEFDLGALNTKIQARKADIERAVYDANAKFVLVVAHTGQEKLGDEVEGAFNAFVDSQNDTSELMSVRVLSQGELHKAAGTGLSGAPISLEIALNGWGHVKTPHYAIYGQVCAADIATWMHSHGNRLFEANLRQFLSGSSVNQDIVDTLLKRPTDFWYFNNGVTAIASEVAKKPIGGNSTDSGIFECTGFSVVNGAQTVGSIHAAWSQSPEAVAAAFVPVRIISSANSAPAFALEVTRCTNTQNAIERRDFVALDPEQDRIRQELQFEGIEYAYKAGTTMPAGTARFDLTEATIALACSNSDVAMAVQAKREIGRLWEDITKAPYKQLFNPGVSGPYIWEVVQILRGIDLSLQAEAKKHTKKDALVCVHGNRFIEWAAFRALQPNPQITFKAVGGKIQPAVLDAVDRVIAAVKSHFPESYPASLFKNVAKCRVLAAKL